MPRAVPKSERHLDLPTVYEDERAPLKRTRGATVRREDRGQLVSVHAHPLVRRLFEIMAEEGVSMRAVSVRAGLNRSAIAQWKRTHMPKVDSLEAALNVVGYKLKIVRRS